MIIFRAWSKDLSKYHKLDDISNDQGLDMFYEVSQIHIVIYRREL